MFHTTPIQNLGFPPEFILREGMYLSSRDSCAEKKAISLRPQLQESNKILELIVFVDDYVVRTIVAGEKNGRQNASLHGGRVWHSQSLTD